MGNSNKDIIKIVSLTIQELKLFEEDSSVKLPNFFSAGIHPWQISVDYEQELNFLIKSNKKIIAIGECGLDKVCKTNFNLQKEIFEEQVKLSIKFSKPLIIHCVKSYNELLEYKKKYIKSDFWIIHGFYGTLQLANQLIAHGFYLSIGYKLIKPDFKNEFNLFYEKNKDKILLESDTTNQIEQVYATISNLVNISIERIKLQQYKNFENIFGVKL